MPHDDGDDDDSVLSRRDSLYNIYWYAVLKNSAVIQKLGVSVGPNYFHHHHHHHHHVLNFEKKLTDAT